MWAAQTCLGWVSRSCRSSWWHIQQITLIHSSSQLKVFLHKFWRWSACTWTLDSGSKTTRDVKSLHRLYFSPAEHRKVCARHRHHSHLTCSQTDLGVGILFLPECYGIITMTHSSQFYLHNGVWRGYISYTKNIYFGISKTKIPLSLHETTRKNIENKGNVPAPQATCSMGRLLCSPPHTNVLGGWPYLIRLTQKNKREAYFLGVNVGEGSGRMILASFAKGAITHSLWYFCFQHYCKCEKNLHVGVDYKPKRSSKLC